MTKPSPNKIGNRIAPLRFLLFLAIFLLATALLQSRLGTEYWSRAVMGGFDLAACFFLLTLLPLVCGAEGQMIRQHAAENDANRLMLLVITTVLTAVLLITVGTELLFQKPPCAPLVIATLALAWLFANTVYALHYAHLFYSDGQGGLQFPETPEPDYGDFLYFAFTLGMTFQTSDVTVTTRAMRRVVLVQSMASFLFNIGILAFTINALGK